MDRLPVRAKRSLPIPSEFQQLHLPHRTAQFSLQFVPADPKRTVQNPFIIKWQRTAEMSDHVASGCAFEVSFLDQAVNQTNQNSSNVIVYQDNSTTIVGGGPVDLGKIAFLALIIALVARRKLQ